MSIKTQHGIALMTVIMFLFIMSLTWLSFSFISSYESDVLQKQVASEKAFYAAEAGVQQALWLLSDPQESQPWNWQSWPANYKETGGTLITEGPLKYYQWTGNLGDSNQAYTVQIRNDGAIQSKIKVGSPNLDSPKRTIEVELGSAFDFGLYSHDQMSFRRRFTVSGENRTGYVYAKGTISNLRRLTADKTCLLPTTTINGGYTKAPCVFPKEIPLPHPAVFRATINGTPTSMSIQYKNDTGEESPGLVSGNQLYNTTRGNDRTINGPPDASTNTITTVASTDNWANGDEIIDDYCQALAQNLRNLSSPNIETYNVTDISLSSFPQNPLNTIIDFTAPVYFCTPTSFSNTSRIHGAANFGQTSSGGNCLGSTTINGAMVIDGDAAFLNQVIVNGRLYVTGSLTTQNLTMGSGGEIVVSGNITINGQVTGGSVGNPVFIITTFGDLSLPNNNVAIGPPFYGLVYVGRNVLSINSINISGGNIIANNFSGNVSNRSSSITNNDWKSNLSGLGFENKDFVRPLLWREKTE